MPAATNRTFRLASRPVGLPTRDNWTFAEEPVEEPGDGEVLVAVELLSLDPAMRGWMNDVPSYIPPVGIGEVMRALGVGRVVQSNDDRFAEGDSVSGPFGIQAFAVMPAAALTKIDTDLAPPEKHLSALGMVGMTAYFGLLDVGQPKEGETVVVSGAAGAVGQLVGQIAKVKGCRVVGIAGGPEKCAFVVDELGFDACVDYKAGDVARGLREHCPKGIDVYFDNVGGDILDAALANLAKRARVVICGAISQYNATDAVQGPANYMMLLVKHASMTGFVVFDYADQYAEGGEQMAQWLADGSVRATEDVVQGLETFPDTLLKLFSGENNGKLVLAV
jgi:NADPH-dependent curcumin reductase CurA